MAAPKMTMALASLLLSGAFAHTSQPASQSIVSVETQQLGTTTSNGILLYSVNYCTVFQTTECGVGLATATEAVSVAAESSAGYSAPVDSITQAVSSAASAVEAPTAPGEPKPTMVWSDAATVVSQPTATVYSVTDSIGSSAETNSVLAATASEAASSGAPSASGSVTASEQSNATSILTHTSASGSMTAPAAPDRTNAGVVLEAFTGVAFGTVAMVMALFM
ncbi:hypothetical protein MKX07_007101 [Trichoderma sp. CBMAI-0711]|uniref:HFB protein n=1 Tax=Trichoderma parareesei TaxID=858221 RepID=A0A2H2ZVJ9_TRIPA|nr:hypothetical protein MKX07_007101 [Trichoderma sp. CBMAI-0711]OTA03294.1 hypothetical protein A9Z42_0037550 [Trichoderma parareesei]